MAACFAAAAFTGVALTTARLLTPDAYLDLYAGRWIAAHGLPRHDPFTVEGHGRAWIDQQWLAHLVYYRMWQLGGYPLVGALSALLVAIAVGMAAWLIVRRTDSPGITLAVLIPAYLLMLTHTQIWAESFAIPLFTLLVALIYDDQRQPDTRTRVLLAIPLIALWANLHGTVLMGAAIAAAYGMWGLVTGRSPMAMPRPGPAEPACRRGDPVWRGHRRVLPLGARERRDPPERQYLGPVVAAQLLQHPFRGDGVAGSGSGRLGGAPRPPAGYSLPAALAAEAFLAGVYAIRYQVWFAIPAAIVAAEALAFTSGGARTLFGQTTRRVAGAVPLVGGGHLRGRARGHLERDLPARRSDGDGDSHLPDHAGTRPAPASWPTTRSRLPCSGSIRNSRAGSGSTPGSRSIPQSRLVGWFRFNDGAPGWDAATSGYDLLAISSSRHPELAARIRAALDWRVDRSDAQGLLASRTRSPAGCG